MNRMKIYQIIEYLKRVDFYHDPHDLEIMGVKEIIAEYGIDSELTDQELQTLADELYTLAEQVEFREAVWLAHNSESATRLRIAELP